MLTNWGGVKFYNFFAYLCKTKICIGIIGQFDKLQKKRSPTTITALTEAISHKANIWI